MSYMIHSCKDRQWYVDNYLIPSMLKQGIKEKEILVYEDKHKEGNLKSFMKSILQLKEAGATWHLQDDIVISKWFTSKTSSYHGKREDIVCGFCSRYDKSKESGILTLDKMWYSFPCIRIPNKFAYEFLDWLEKEGKREYGNAIADNKHDDFLFQEFLKDRHPKIKVELLNPNIVNHVDYLIGGSKINPFRNGENVLSYYWNDHNTINDLERRLKEHGKAGEQD